MDSEKDYVIDKLTTQKRIMWFIIILFVITIIVFLLEFQLVCKYTNRIIDRTNNFENVMIKSIAIGKTHLSALTMPLKRLAHWDILCFDTNGELYVVYTNKEKGITNFNVFINGIEYDGNRSIFIDKASNLRWKYRIDSHKIYQLQKPISLFKIAREFSNNLMKPYHALNYNCFHNCRKTIQSISGKWIENKTFDLVTIMSDVPSAIHNFVNK